LVVQSVACRYTDCNAAAVNGICGWGKKPSTFPWLEPCDAPTVALGQPFVVMATMSGHWIENQNVSFAAEWVQYTSTDCEHLEGFTLTLRLSAPCKLEWAGHDPDIA
jgi:hypothetical protein